MDKKYKCIPIVLHLLVNSSNGVIAPNLEPQVLENNHVTPPELVLQMVSGDIRYRGPIQSMAILDRMCNSGPNIIKLICGNEELSQQTLDQHRNGQLIVTCVIVGKVTDPHDLWIRQYH